MGRAGRAGGDRRAGASTSTRPASRLHPARVRGVRPARGAGRRDADAGDGLRLRAGRAGGRAGARRGRGRAGRAGRRRLLRARRRARLRDRGTRASLVGRRARATRSRSATARCAPCGPPSGCAPSRARASARRPLRRRRRALHAARRRIRSCARSTSTPAGSGRSRAADAGHARALTAAVARVPGVGAALRPAASSSPALGRRAGAGHDARRAVLDRRRGPDGAGGRWPRSARGRRPLRVHRRLPRLGGAAGRARGRGPTGAVGPLEAFGLDALERGMRGGGAGRAPA